MKKIFPPTTLVFFRYSTLVLVAGLLLDVLTSSSVKAQHTNPHPIRQAAAQTTRRRIGLAWSTTDELKTLYDISTLPAYRSGTRSLQVSTYDPTGGNEDGFSGDHSFIRRNTDSSLVIFESAGPGVIERIWTPTPTEDTLDFFIDDTIRPVLSIAYKDLFSDQSPPFEPPLCGSALGGNYCYFPILFNELCRIVCRGKKMQFHQIQYRLLPKNTQAKSFSPRLTPEEKAALENIKSLWNSPPDTPPASQSTPLLQARMIASPTLPASILPPPALPSSTASSSMRPIASISSSFQLHPGETRQIAHIRQGGRITGIELGPASAFEGAERQLFLRISWDNQRLPAINCPVADFFGYAFGKPSMRSLLLGTQGKKNYCYFPMPFDQEAKIELVYKALPATTSPSSPLPITTKIYYTYNKRDSTREGRLYTSWKSERPATGQPHVFLDTRGRGHYVGTLLQAQGLQPGMTYFFEGDDSTVIDGNPALHGTGSEDYFNGGWYAFQDCWDTRMSLPIHGALDYSLPYCRTGGYRLYLSDKISFENNIYHSIEHGPAHNAVPVEYTSLAFYYCDTPPASITAAVPTRLYEPDTLVLFPQLLEYGVWNDIAIHPLWAYPTGGESYDLTVTANSHLRISLKDILPGHYRLYADYENNGRGARFSIWQRQTQLSPWQSTWSRDKTRSPMTSLGEITIDKTDNTLTVHFLTDKNQDHFFLNRLVLVKQPALH